MDEAKADAGGRLGPREMTEPKRRGRPPKIKPMEGETPSTQVAPLPETSTNPVVQDGVTLDPVSGDEVASTGDGACDHPGCGKDSVEQSMATGAEFCQEHLATGVPMGGAAGYSVGGGGYSPMDAGAAFSPSSSGGVGYSSVYGGEAISIKIGNGGAGASNDPAVIDGAEQMGAGSGVPKELSDRQIAALDRDYDGEAGGSWPVAELSELQTQAYAQNAIDAHEGQFEVKVTDAFNRIWSFRHEVVKNHLNVMVECKRGPKVARVFCPTSTINLFKAEEMIRECDAETRR